MPRGRQAAAPRSARADRRAGARLDPRALTLTTNPNPDPDPDPNTSTRRAGTKQGPQDGAHHLSDLVLY